MYIQSWRIGNDELRIIADLACQASNPHNKDTHPEDHKFWEECQQRVVDITFECDRNIDKNARRIANGKDPLPVGVSSPEDFVKEAEDALYRMLCSGISQWEELDRQFPSLRPCIFKAESAEAS